MILDNLEVACTFLTTCTMTIKQLFNDVPIDNVFLFLKEINLFNRL